MHVFKAILAIALLSSMAILTVGCGSATTNTANAAPTAANCTSGFFRSNTGTLQTVSGNTLQFTDRNGKSIKASYSSSTRFARQGTATSAALQNGMFVTVAVTQNNNTFVATRISLSERTPNFGRGNGNGNGRTRNSACARPTRTPNAGQSNARSIAGTVAQLSGQTLTVTDASGSDYFVTLNSATQITQTQTASASDLKPGMTIAIMGMPDSQGTIKAQSVTILPSSALTAPKSGN